MSNKEIADVNGLQTHRDAIEEKKAALVVAPFLPSPLVERLAGEGFASKVERGQGSDWLVYFWRETE